MSDREIRVGDKVWYIGDKDLSAKQLIIKGMQGVVTAESMHDDELCVDFGFASHVRIRDMELVPPIDKRTEFLSRLQSLLKEYDACVIPRCAISGTYERGLRLKIGNDEIVYRSRNELNADNIMDFEKE